MLHPALREKGRAIPQQKPISVASVTGLDGSVPKVNTNCLNLIYHNNISRFALIIFF
jgi:hypothetical protein